MEISSVCLRSPNTTSAQFLFHMRLVCALASHPKSIRWLPKVKYAPTSKALHESNMAPIQPSQDVLEHDSKRAWVGGWVVLVVKGEEGVRQITLEENFRWTSASSAKLLFSWAQASPRVLGTDKQEDGEEDCTCHISGTTHTFHVQTREEGRQTLACTHKHSHRWGLELVQKFTDTQEAVNQRRRAEVLGRFSRWWGCMAHEAGPVSLPTASQHSWGHSHWQGPLLCWG